MPINLLLLVLFVCLTPLSIAQISSEKYHVKYGQIELGARKAYQLELLQAALDATIPSHGRYTLTVIKNTDDWSTARYRHLLKQGELINTSWGIGGTHDPIRNGVYRIPYPILKNANGYRVFVINTKDQPKFDNITNLDELKNIRIGQGKQWYDIFLLRKNNLTVIESPITKNLFSMLSHGRFDGISLGILETQNELSNTKHNISNLSIEKNLLLFYPFPIYFQVSENNPHIAERLNEGMRIVTQDGILDDIFHKHFDTVIRNFKLSERKMIVLENHFIDHIIEEETMLQPPLF